MIPKRQKSDSVQIAVRVDIDTHRHLLQLAHTEGVRISDVIRHIIRLGLDAYADKNKQNAPQQPCREADDAG